MSPDARERWIQRILDGQGVRPVGHQDPRDETAPQGGDTAVMAASAIGNPFPLWTRRKTTAAPAVPPRPAQPPTPPAPPVPPTTAPPTPQTPPAAPAATAPSSPPAVHMGWKRLPKWGGAGNVPTGPQVPVQPTPAAPAAPQAPTQPTPATPAAPAPPAPAAGPQVPTQPQPVPPPPGGPTPTGPVEKVRAAPPRRFSKKPASARGRVFDVANDRSARVIGFNASAAVVGYGVGLVPLLGQMLPAAENGAVGILSLVLAAGSGYAAWQVTRPAEVQKILPVAPLSRVIIATGAAEIGRRFAPAPVEWINQYGTEWGLGPDSVSLLLTAGGMCGGLWWLIDRRVRAWHWLGRWVLRIPLASALCAAALYAPGPYGSY